LHIAISLRGLCHISKIPKDYNESGGSSSRTALQDGGQFLFQPREFPICSTTGTRLMVCFSSITRRYSALSVPLHCADSPILRNPHQLCRLLGHHHPVQPGHKSRRFQQLIEGQATCTIATACHR